MFFVRRYLSKAMNIQKKSTLAAKLAKKAKAQSSNAATVITEQLQDIEDIVKPVHHYFSPLQTRQQRKLNLLAKSEVPPKRAKNSFKNMEVKTKPNIAEKSKNEFEEILTEPKPELKIKQKTKLPIDISPKNAKVAEQSSSSTKSITIECSDDLKSEKWEPLHWQQTLDNIRTMRRSEAAPVDSMGCHKCADDNADAKTQRFQKLIALMLSSQTKDETTFQAMKRLKSKTLTPISVSEMPVDVLEALLHPVSFYRNKAKYMKQTAKILIDKYDADIPNNIKELEALPGVGPKMAHICMATAWNQITGIGVDVHVHRISNRLKWLPKATKEPDQTRQALEAWLPQELWAEVNHLLVGFGQTVCTPVKPKCDQCLNVLECPSALQGAKEKFELKNRIKLALAQGHS